MKHILFLASGGGGNFKFLYHAMQNELIEKVQLSVIADRSCGAVEYAKFKNIDNTIIVYNHISPYALRELLKQKNPDIIVTNWNKIIDPATVRDYQGRLLNLHYSLLPAFGGLIGVEPIKRAYDLNCKFMGPTCHLVDEELDAGKILVQSVFPTEPSLELNIRLMFQTGCLVLLSGIEILLGHKITKFPGKSSRFFSPMLEYDQSKFDDEFWSFVANA